MRRHEYPQYQTAETKQAYDEGYALGQAGTVRKIPTNPLVSSAPGLSMYDCYATEMFIGYMDAVEDRKENPYGKA